MATRLVAPPRWRLSIASESWAVALAGRSLEMTTPNFVVASTIWPRTTLSSRPREGSCGERWPPPQSLLPARRTISFSGGAGQAGRTILKGRLAQIGTGVGSTTAW